MKNYKRIIAIILVMSFVAFGVLGAFSAEPAAQASTTQTAEQPEAAQQGQPESAESVEVRRPTERVESIRIEKESRWSRLLQFIVNAIILGIVGILLLIIGYYIWELVTVNYSVREQLVDHKNTAVAIVTASFVIGMAIVIGIALTKI